VLKKQSLFPYKRQNQLVLSALPWKAFFFCFPVAFASVLLRCVFTLSGVPRPAKSAVCVNQIGVKPVVLFPV
ncbi:hypothetical protein, partial [Nocardiopsis valliformis]|uniref:hypothetical protein n=1 Tax=Nocardiopsis valliformis TaxID=239974 RepID=UPI001955468B